MAPVISNYTGTVDLYYILCGIKNIANANLAERRIAKTHAV